MEGDWPLDCRSPRCFAYVAEQKSFSGASARLRIAQPALSRQIRQLEEELGIEAFTRHARSVDLTFAGEILLARVYTIFRQVEQSRDDVTTQTQFPSGTVTVGLPRPAVYGTSFPRLHTAVNRSQSRPATSSVYESYGLRWSIAGGGERLTTGRKEQRAQKWEEGSNAP